MVEVAETMMTNTSLELNMEGCGCAVAQDAPESTIVLSTETRMVEALLFAATEPVSTDFLAERVPEGTDVGGILEDIQNLYEGRGVNLKRVG